MKLKSHLSRWVATRALGHKLYQKLLVFLCLKLHGLAAASYPCICIKPEQKAKFFCPALILLGYLSHLDGYISLSLSSPYNPFLIFLVRDFYIPRNTFFLCRNLVDSLSFCITRYSQPNWHQEDFCNSLLCRVDWFGVTAILHKLNLKKLLIAWIWTLQTGR